MGLRCLIGHDYGEPQTSRDRMERGNEVVVTVSEYRECTRCGHRRLLSENKEIKADASSEDDPAAEAEWTSGEKVAAEQSPGEPSGRVRTTRSSPSHEESMTAAEDDGVILDQDTEEDSRRTGEWPDADLGEEDDDPVEDQKPWPDEAAGPTPDEPAEPEPPSPADDPLDVGPEPTADSASEGAAAETEGPDDAGTTAGGSDESSTPRPDTHNTEFVCPDCEETWPSRNASLRPGDICPECRSGYLDERIVQ